ncbi:hypothetical protein C7271_12815 [filamentous cyanobacterium CCP5]|nr:hypothetical protein C7271_12815 [filamentous cyanobacterium CCP5]
MGLFDQVMQAIDDPNRIASTTDLGQIAKIVQQLGQQSNASPEGMQQAVSILGGFVKSSLKETRAQQGDAAAQALVDQGSQSGAAVIGRLFSGGQQQQIAQTVSDRTGLNMAQVQALLPTLIPIVMKLLNSGNTRQAGEINNNVLSTFLDGDGDGDVDMGDMIGMASRFAR